VKTLAKETIEKVAKHPQAQYSLMEQLEELRSAAIKLGLYDADDWLMRRIYYDKDV
jgi:hypothetical protein